MKQVLLAIGLVVAPVVATAGAADCGVPTAGSVKNYYSSAALSQIAANGGTVRVFSSGQYYSSTALMNIAGSARGGNKGGKLVLCVDDTYYSISALNLIADAGAEVVILN